MATSNQEDIESIDPTFVAFDKVIGCIEDIIISEEFRTTQYNYLRKHCGVFDPEEENKLVYTSIFQSYSQLVENFLEEKLTKMIPYFSMDRFTEELKSKQQCLEGEVFDILREFTDFQSFKDMMVDLNMSKDKNFDHLMVNGIKINETWH